MLTDRIMTIWSNGRGKLRMTSIGNLVKAVKQFQFENKNDAIRAYDLSESIFDEWIKLKERFKKKMANKKNFSEQLYDEMYAEESILIGLIFLINEELIIDETIS